MLLAVAEVLFIYKTSATEAPIVLILFTKNDY